MLVADIPNEEGGPPWRSHSVGIDVPTYGVKQLGVGGTVSNDEKNVKVEEEGHGLDKCVISPLAILEHIVPVG